jgi:hypothetical protein
MYLHVREKKQLITKDDAESRCCYSGRLHVPPKPRPGGLRGTSVEGRHIWLGVQKDAEEAAAAATPEVRLGRGSRTSPGGGGQLAAENIRWHGGGGWIHQGSAAARGNGRLRIRRRPAWLQAKS